MIGNTSHGIHKIFFLTAFEWVKWAFCLIQFEQKSCSCSYDWNFFRGFLETTADNLWEVELNITTQDKTEILIYKYFKILRSFFFNVSQENFITWSCLALGRSSVRDHDGSKNLFWQELVSYLSCYITLSDARNQEERNFHLFRLFSLFSFIVKIYHCENRKIALNATFWS